MSQVTSISLVPFLGHGDYFWIGTDLHQSKTVGQGAFSTGLESEKVSPQCLGTILS